MSLRFFTILSLVMLSISGCGLTLAPQSGSANPRIVSPQEVPRIIKTIPSYTTFDYSGLAFFNGRVYASSNIGLLEYEGGHLSRLYKWYDRDDVISGPWPDPSHNSLWMLHEGLSKLIRYDGNSWVIVERPEPKEGLTRGDVLQGFRGTGNSNGFWLEGAGHVWRWLNDRNSLSLDPTPNGSVARIIPIGNRVLYVMRNESVYSWNLDDEPTDAQSDVVYYFDNQWKQVPNRSRVNYYAEQTVTVGDTGFIRSRRGQILRVSPVELTVMESPGVSEALTTTSSGTLLASFINLGIYEYTNGWHKRFAAPYPQTKGEHWAYLAEHDSQVAFAITPKPQISGDGQQTYAGQSTLWISSANELHVLPTEGR